MAMYLSINARPTMARFASQPLPKYVDYKGVLYSYYCNISKYDDNVESDQS